MWLKVLRTHVHVDNSWFFRPHLINWKSLLKKWRDYCMQWSGRTHTQTLTLGEWWHDFGQVVNCQIDLERISVNNNTLVFRATQGHVSLSELDTAINAVPTLGVLILKDVYTQTHSSDCISAILYNLRTGRIALVGLYTPHTKTHTKHYDLSTDLYVSVWTHHTNNQDTWPPYRFIKSCGCCGCCAHWLYAMA